MRVVCVCVDSRVYVCGCVGAWVFFEERGERGRERGKCAWVSWDWRVKVKMKKENENEDGRKKE